MKYIYKLLLLILNINFCSIDMVVHDNTPGNSHNLFMIKIPPGNKIKSCKNKQRIFFGEEIFEELFNELPVVFPYSQEAKCSAINNFLKHQQDAGVSLTDFKWDNTLFNAIKDDLPIDHSIVYDPQSVYFIIRRPFQGNIKIDAYVIPKLFIWHWEKKFHNTNIYRFESCYGKQHIWKKESLMRETFCITFTIKKPEDEIYEFIVLISTNEQEVEFSLNINGSPYLEMLENLFFELRDTLKYGNPKVSLRQIIEKHVIDNGFQIMYIGQQMYEIDMDRYRMTQLVKEISKELFVDALKNPIEQMTKTTKARPWYTRLLSCFRYKEPV